VNPTSPSLNTRRLLPLFAVLLLAATAASATEIKEIFDRTVPLRAGASFALRNVNGGIAVEAWNRDEVQIHAEKKVRAGSSDAARKLMDQVKIDVTQEGGGVRVETKLPRRDNGFFDWLFGNQASVNVTYKIRVPRQVAADIENVNGAIALTGTRGKSRLETTNGGITVNDVDGDLRLGSTNGGIDVHRSAGTLRADTTNGGISAELTDFPDGGELRLTSTNGGIDVSLPRDARVSIDAGTTNGRVHTDLPVEGGQPGKRSLKGEVNGGGTTLYLRTTNGGIDINAQ
jgi:DUF4097 and DUF4098 domain-containing protein YvlB